MKKEFMLLIRNRVDHLSHLSLEENHKFLKACEAYIETLTKNGNLKAAQPYEKEGKVISGSKTGWQETYYNDTPEVMVGYYHIFADSIDEAVEIAKQNPEFAYTTSASIEVRPLKTKEHTTAFVYPNKN